MKANILDLFYSGYWAITEDKLALINSIASREELPEEIRQFRTTLKEKSISDNAESISKQEQKIENESDTVIIYVNGAIVPFGNMFSDMSGSLSIQMLANEFEQALNSENVKNIIFSFHSPGGEVTGVSEFSDFIRDSVRQSKKNIYAYAYGDCCSAAYWIGSAVKVGNFIASPTARIGSIGVISNIVDTREKDAKEGVKQLLIRSNVSPNKNPDVFTDEGFSQYQENIDALAEVFIKKISRNRGVSRRTVLNNYGQGKVFVGQEAMDAGLVDKIGNLSSILSELKE